MKLNIYILAVILSAFKGYSESSSFTGGLSETRQIVGMSELSTGAVNVNVLFVVKPVEYFQAVDRIASANEAHVRTNAVAMEQFENCLVEALTRSCPTNPGLALDCFSAKASIAQRLARVSLPRPHYRVAETLAQFLGEVRARTISHYVRAEVTINVIPPATAKAHLTTSYSAMFAGMDPKTIDDPEVRAAYEKAISENVQRRQMNELQLVVLPRVNRDSLQFLLEYCGELFGQNSEAKNQANSLATLAHLTEDERCQLK